MLEKHLANQEAVILIVIIIQYTKANIDNISLWAMITSWPHEKGMSFLNDIPFIDYLSRFVFDMNMGEYQYSVHYSKAQIWISSASLRICCFHSICFCRQIESNLLVMWSQYTLFAVFGGHQVVHSYSLCYMAQRGILEKWNVKFVNSYIYSI